jgi:hypothetical protein
MRLPPRKHLFVAIAILVAGWAVGIAIYLLAAPEEALPFELTYDSKRSLYRLEQLGGKSAVLYQQIDDFLSSLWHAPRLGITIGVSASLLALAWFLVARRNRVTGPRSR